MSSLALAWDQWIALGSAVAMLVVLVRQMIALRREKYEEIDFVGDAGGHDVSLVRSATGELLIGITFTGYRTGRLRAYLTPDEARRFAASIRPRSRISAPIPGHIL
jgi:hypothetical protein